MSWIDIWHRETEKSFKGDNFVVLKHQDHRKLLKPQRTHRRAAWMSCTDFIKRVNLSKVQDDLKMSVTEKISYAAVANTVKKFGQDMKPHSKETKLILAKRINYLWRKLFHVCLPQNYLTLFCSYR